MGGMNNMGQQGNGMGMPTQGMQMGGMQGHGMQNMGNMQGQQGMMPDMQSMHNGGQQGGMHMPMGMGMGMPMQGHMGNMMAQQQHNFAMVCTETNAYIS